MSVEGLNVLAGRDGPAGAGAVFGLSAAGAPPYFESDSPGRTKAAGALCPRGACGATGASDA